MIELNRRELLQNVAAGATGIAAASLSSFSFANDSQSPLKAMQSALLSVLNQVPGGADINKEEYLKDVGRGTDQIRFNYEKNDVTQMSQQHIASVLKITGFVWQPTVRVNVWMQCQEDAADGPAEVGGLIVDEPKRPFLGIRNDTERDMEYINRFGSRVIPSGSTGRTYEIPRIALRNIPHVGEYHLHVKNMEGRPPEDFGPSGRRPLYANQSYGGDLGFAAYRINQNGSTHQIVVSLSKAATGEKMPSQPEIKRGLQGINFHYFGGEKDKKGVVQVYVLNLGTFYNKTFYPIPEVLNS